MSRIALEGERAPTRASEYPKVTFCVLPRRRKRHARLSENAVGLGRRTPNEPERLPLDCPEPHGPGGQRSCILFMCMAPPRTLSSEPRRTRLVKDWLLTSDYRTVLIRELPRKSSGLKDASHQRLQPTHQTSTLWTARFPGAPKTNLAAVLQALNYFRPESLQQLPE